jgi:hypothetical protein
VEVTQAQVDAAVAAARIGAASYVAELGMHHVGTAADMEERLLRRHPYPAQAARLAGIVDSLADLTRSEIELMQLRARRNSGR